MTRRRVIAFLALLVTTIVIAWVLFVGLPRWTAPKPASAPTAAQPPAPAEPTRRIRARLFYMTPDGLRLQPSDAEVEFGEGTPAQASRIVEALLGLAPQPLLNPIPSGTELRSMYVSPQGVAFVDLSGEVSRNHPGGVLQEILTVYSLVNTLTDNLPAITAVQVLIEGREVDTLAGHVDLRRPLSKNLGWTEAPAPPQTTSR